MPDAPPQCLVEGPVGLYLVPLVAIQQVPLPRVQVVVLSLQLNLKGDGNINQHPASCRPSPNAGMEIDI